MGSVGNCAGLLDLCERGCGCFDFLIVNGAARGQMWSDMTPDCPLRPACENFTGWYLDWVTRCINTIKREPLIDKIRVGMSVDDVRGILGTDMRRSTAELPDGPAYYIGFTYTNASFAVGEDHRILKIVKMHVV